MSQEVLEIAVSPCPNDTFWVGPLALGWVELPFPVRFVFEDIETLNRWALEERFPVLKISFALLPEIQASYKVLPVGAALGQGAGPLVVARKTYSLEELSNLKVLLPGEHTTAHLLFKLAFPEASQKIFCPYHQILPALLQGRAEVGVLIHESRFVFDRYGLKALLDLGRWWEEETGLPLPLGGLVAHRGLPSAMVKTLIQALRQSLTLASQRRELLWSFMQERAQELAPEIIAQHLETYVNSYTYDLGAEGRKALQILLERAGQDAKDLFWEEI